MSRFIKSSSLRVTGLFITLTVLVFGFQNCGDASWKETQGQLAQKLANDFDNDGLSSVEEVKLGTDPRSPDSDNDGLSDGAEVNQTLTNPLVADTDGGGLTDGVEVSMGFDPLSSSDDTLLPDSDLDGDGLTLEKEEELGTDPMNADSDGDGLTDGAEYSVHKSNPLDVDTDKGGVHDGTEVSFGNSPIDAADDTSNVDSDQDGLLDSQESILGTNPNMSDTDGDGLTDGAEIFTHSTNPLVEDTDEGGVNDGDEVSLNTNPLSKEDDTGFAVPETGTETSPGSNSSSDSDKDGLTDDVEKSTGTDPSNPDTDGDGLTDGAEVNTYMSNPLYKDTDRGGVVDGKEVSQGTDPNDKEDDYTNLDSDRDGLTNAVEKTLETDPLNSDTDGDGLTDGAEVLTYKTDPLSVDTDKGGINDGYEVSNAMDPLDAEDDFKYLNRDTDSDGLIDSKEKEIGTDPNNPDTDGDGLTDGAEVNTYETNPLDKDTDKGGMNDGLEVNLGLDPNNPGDDFNGIGENCKIEEAIGIWSDADLLRSPESESFISSVEAFMGTRTSANNYGYNSYSAHPIKGVQPEKGKLKFFLYNGSDGLSLNFVASADNSGTQAWEEINFELTVYNNNKREKVLLSDDHMEVRLMKSSDLYNMYSAKLRYIDNSDGGVIGPLAEDDYSIHIKFGDMKDVTSIEFVNANGSVVQMEAGKKAYIIGNKRSITCDSGDGTTLVFDKFPEQISKVNNAEFVFSLLPEDSEAKTTCSLDGASFVDCNQNEGVIFTNLPSGMHEFAVVVDKGETSKAYKYVWGVYKEGTYVEALCQNSDLVVQSFNFAFTKTTGACPWGVGEHLQPKNEYMQAYVKQTETIQLSPNFHVCDVSLQTSKDNGDQKIFYDDNFYFNFNNSVIATNLISSLNFMQSETVRFDWESDLKGKALGPRRTSELYCLGGKIGEDCFMPLTQSTGDFSLSFSDEALRSVAPKGTNSLLTFDMVVVGDNDAATDCKHSGFKFDVNVKGVMIK